MNLPSDWEARKRALTDLHATLIVEAAAGTGKTALIAGRTISLLTEGVHPANIAAITFTEAAASELAARVHQYATSLLEGIVPPELSLAFPEGLSAAQRSNLKAGVDNFDAITTATIHSFCQRVILAFAVESDIDPGAQVLDADSRDAAYLSIVRRWLRRRLDQASGAEDPISVISSANPRGIVSTIQRLAKFRLQYRRGNVPAPDLGGRPDLELESAVADFGRWLGDQPHEENTHALYLDLEKLAQFYANSFANAPTFTQLWRLANPHHLDAMKTGRSTDLKTPRWKGKWHGVAENARASQLDDEMRAHFARVRDAYGALRGRVSAAIFAALDAELTQILDEYDAFKRAAAVLDFDDLLEKAHSLIRGHDNVRAALGQQYQHILIDEFQDTDEVQCAILFGIAGATTTPDWRNAQLRPGSLFMVGDPKQAIYGFRGADVQTYLGVRDRLCAQNPEGILHLTANFRSRPEILAHVNDCFGPAFSTPMQPDYVPLTPTRHGASGPSVIKVVLDLTPDRNVDQIRLAEAQAVCDLCLHLLATYQIGEGDAARPLRPEDIALLTPQSTKLSIYERVFAERGLPFASLAGKSLYQRQEVQDMLALVRVLADPQDDVAFGALMRGPLVGLTDQELLDITAALPGEPSTTRFTATTRPELLTHPTAKRIVELLQEATRLSRKTSPALILEELVDRLLIHPILANREPGRWVQAVANIDALIQRARQYDVRGLKAFARDFEDDWSKRAGKEDRIESKEGRIDGDGSVTMVTVHAAKGLEWPVTIPINMITRATKYEDYIHRSDDNTLHWIIDDVTSPDLERALTFEAQRLRREQLRLWYVACTRSRDLMVIPDIPGAGDDTWTRIVDLRCADLVTLDLATRPHSPSNARETPNVQTVAKFTEEGAAIRASSQPLSWRRASDADSDRIPEVEVVEPDGQTTLTPSPVGAGRIRGLILHKLMEEVLGNECPDGGDHLVRRAGELLTQLGDDRPEGTLPDAQEMAAAVVRTLGLPDIAALRPTLLPELPVYSLLTQPDGTHVGLAGRMDALATTVDQGVIPIDWKSDVQPTAEDVAMHTAQLEDYLRAVGANNGALVYMTPGTVYWIRRPAEAADFDPETTMPSTQ